LKLRTIGAGIKENKMKDGAVFHDSKGRVRLSLGVNDKNQPRIDFFDEQGVNRLLISMGDEGVPVIIFTDKKGKEDLALSGFLIRLGNHNGEHLQIDRAQSKPLSVSQVKKGVPSLDSSRVNQRLLCRMPKT
jgi:hypothetical protein